MKYIFLIFTLLVACAPVKQDADQSTNNCSEKQVEKVVEHVVPKFESEFHKHRNIVGNVVRVREGGMTYVFHHSYKGVVSVINYTKDSIEVTLLKQQAYKDSIQIEVFKKYLNK